MTTQDIVYRKQKSFLLSEVAQRLLQLLAAHYGINQTSVLEIAIRNMAVKENLPLE